MIILSRASGKISSDCDTGIRKRMGVWKVMNRCRWCNEKNPLYVRYHDEEWGVLRTDDAYLFEMLLLESFQAGLSWECVLNKRENFRLAFDGFQPEKISRYDEEKVAALLGDPGIIRNRLKIRAAIRNSGIFLDIVEEYGSFYRYVCGFTGGGILRETGKSTNAWSDALSRDLRRRGMRFVGSTILYAWLQAVGVIDSHEPGCDLAVRVQSDRTEGKSHAEQKAGQAGDL